MKKSSILAAVALVCVVVASGCKKEAGQSGDIIKIGEFASLTGKEAAFGQSSHKGTLLADFAKRMLKAERVAILTDVAVPYSVGLAKYFKEPFVAKGGTIVMEKSFSSGDKDFKPQLTAIKAADPQAIFAPCYYTEAGLIAVQARQLAISAPLFGGDGWEAPELIQIGGSALEGTYYSTHYSAELDSPLVQNFVKKFKARF